MPKTLSLFIKSLLIQGSFISIILTIAVSQAVAANDFSYIQKKLLSDNFIHGTVKRVYSAPQLKIK